MIKNSLKLVLITFGMFVYNSSFSQITERERPAEWQYLAKGARFMDRFLPMKGEVLSSDTWGMDYVKPRYIDNGIEDNIWSYWCGDIIKAYDDSYRMFVCGWLESSPKGHYEWPNSYVFEASSHKLEGPYTLKKMIGRGHNVDYFRAKGGQSVLYVIDGRYVADSIDGPWTYGKFDFDARDRKIIEGLSNLSFAQREDGTYLMVCRGGGIWVSEDGLSTYKQLTDKRVYPPVDGRFEDPVMWRDHIQYHLIVNDWLGRIAYYLRSKNGVNWVVDPGEAYMPGISFHEDGTVENWFKYERMRVYQDEYGRAIQANFAVVDLQKEEDFGSDNHSSKQITIPLNPGLLLSLIDNQPITDKTKTIQLRIQAEEGFNPLTDIDINTLRFGASSEVNYGRGCKVLKTENEGENLIVTFDAQGNGITEEEFAPKLIGKYKNGKMLYGYARLPYIDYISPILSASAPLFQKQDKRWNGTIEVQNFGLIASKKASLKVEYMNNGKKVSIAQGKVPQLQPYEKINLPLSCNKVSESSNDQDLIITIYSGKKTLSTFNLIRKR